MKNKKYGNIYEIKLPKSGAYLYVCWIEEFSFGIFNYKVEKPIDSVEKLLPLGFKVYKSCKETGIRKKEWKLIGHIDLEKENIQWPDLANYNWWDNEGSIERSNITRNGSLLKVDKDYFLELVEKGLIDGFFDNHKTFELWFDNNFDKYPDIDKYPPKNED